MKIILPSTQTSAIREGWHGSCYSSTTSAGPITAEDHGRIKMSSCQRSPIQAEHIQHPPAIQSKPIQGPQAQQARFCRGTAKLLLQLLRFFPPKDPGRRSPIPHFCFAVLSPQVTFLCNLSLETINLPWSPDAHQHIEQMRRQSWETGRLQSDTSQVWLCGYVSLFPLLSDSCEVSLRSPLRTERAGSFSWKKGRN